MSYYFDKLREEWNQEQVQEENRKIIDRLTAGSRRPPDSEIIRRMKVRYSKYAEHHGKV